VPVASGLFNKLRADSEGEVEATCTEETHAARHAPHRAAGEVMRVPCDVTICQRPSRSVNTGGQALVAEPTVEGLNEGILHGFAGSREIELHAAPNKKFVMYRRS
jgi:hypothetical protein